MSSEHAVQGGRYRIILFALASVLTLVGGCSTVAPAASGPRPETWARPVAARPGLPNLHRVNASLYRSAQPTKEGFVFLGTQPSLANADRPIKTVVSLRAFNDDAPLVPASSVLRLEQIRSRRGTLKMRMWSNSCASQPHQHCNPCSCIVSTARIAPGQWWPSIG